MTPFVAAFSYQSLRDFWRFEIGMGSEFRMWPIGTEETPIGRFCPPIKSCRGTFGYFPNSFSSTLVNKVLKTLLQRRLQGARGLAEDAMLLRLSATITATLTADKLPCRRPP